MQESFPNFFYREVTPFSIKAKKDSRFMRLLNFLLTITNFLRITAIDNFLDNYVTTIRRMIYGKNDWSMEMGANATLIHELAHVMQWVYHGCKYERDYLFSSKRRAYWESVAVQASALVFGGWEINPESWVEWKAAGFTGYGIPVDVMKDELRARIGEMRRSDPKKEAKVIYEAYTTWKTRQGSY